MPDHGVASENRGHDRRQTVDLQSCVVRAVGITEPGGVDVIRVIDRQVRQAGPGEVRIAVKSAAVNPTDSRLRELGGGRRPPPWVPGMEAAGIIESVGESVERFSVGDQVMAAVNARRPEGGAQAEMIVAPAASVVPIPEGVSLEQASTLPMNGLTARLGLEMLAPQAGQTIAVSGGAGLLASYFIPLAKARGVRVIADAKPEDTDLVSGFGADIVVPRSADFACAIREVAQDGVDAMFDTAILGRGSFASICDGGSVAALRDWSDYARWTERSIEVHQVRVSSALDRTDWLEELRGLASTGTITLRVAGRYAPEQAALAQLSMGAGGLRGRALIVF